MYSIPRPINAFLRSTSGTAAIEFGLALPLLAALLIGVVEIGFSAYQAMQVTYAAEAGLFYAAKNGWNQTGIANAAANAAALPGITASASQFCGCPTVNGIATAACGTPCTGGSPAGQYIEISVTLPRRSIIGSSGLPLPATLSAQSILRQD